MLAGPFSLVAVQIILSLQGRIKNVIKDMLRISNRDLVWQTMNIFSGLNSAIINMPWFMKLYIRDMISR